MHYMKDANEVRTDLFPVVTACLFIKIRFSRFYCNSLLDLLAVSGTIPKFRRRLFQF